MEPKTDSFLTQRLAMVEVQLRQRGIRDKRVLDAMARVPRHEFVSAEKQPQAYEDQPIAIEAGQTISQPYIVAAMLQALALQPSDSVLEVGTGSGYQTALLAELAAQVYSIERHEILSSIAESRLYRLGYRNVMFVVGDGSLGLSEHAPYDATIVAAAAPQVPAKLMEQLNEGGRLIIPVGSAENQQLQLIRKIQGQPIVRHLDGCRFVPLIGRQGFAED